MTLDHAVSLFSATLSFVGLMLVVYQLRASTKQRESDSIVKIYDINRQLLTLGFSHPQLFDILTDAPNADPMWERRYLQLWLNQLSLILTFLNSSVQSTELKACLRQNLTEFFSYENMRRHWKDNAVFYPESFQTLVNEIVKKAGLAEAAQLVDSSSGI